ncbi:MAG TPA: short-chain dehydrogenase [Nitrospiraceae bacterium]|jgi:NAD(P)-dependent dehydrogenase (short-subunit alcohol dehydrogenase family)|nr:short-chain dehydrogenase [Nitrospiraceae bacterium]
MSATRIALVTGANKGLGFETSRQLARQGIKVLMGARSLTRGKTAAKKLRREGLDVEFIHLDVTKPEHIRQAAQYIKDASGRLDILVNDAGMAQPEEFLSANSTETVSPKVLRTIFDVNFFGLVELTQTLLPLIRNSDAGRIVNVSSILGSLTLHSKEGSGDQVKPFAYDASKTAVNAFTIHLAAALKGTPIKVNSAHPGWVKTDMGGEQAPMSVQEGVKTAVMLATLGGDGPTGKFFHFKEELPW